MLFSYTHAHESIRAFTCLYMHSMHSKHDCKFRNENIITKLKISCKFNNFLIIIRKDKKF